MDALLLQLEPVRDFAKDSVRLVKRCTKPDRKEFVKIAMATAIGFAIMGFIGFFVKLIHIPINNIIVGAWGREVGTLLTYRLSWTSLLIIDITHFQPHIHFSSSLQDLVDGVAFTFHSSCCQLDVMGLYHWCRLPRMIRVSSTSLRFPAIIRQHFAWRIHPLWQSLFIAHIWKDRTQHPPPHHRSPSLSSSLSHHHRLPHISFSARMNLSSPPAVSTSSALELRFLWNTRQFQIPRHHRCAAPFVSLSAQFSSLHLAIVDDEILLFSLFRALTICYTIVRSNWGKIWYLIDS